MEVSLDVCLIAVKEYTTYRCLNRVLCCRRHSAAVIECSESQTVEDSSLPPWLRARVGRSALCKPLVATSCVLQPRPLYYHPLESTVLWYNRCKMTRRLVRLRSAQSTCVSNCFTSCLSKLVGYSAV